MLTRCCFSQYHTFARRQDTEAQNKLKKLRDCIRRWEVAISSDHMSARRKARPRPPAARASSVLTRPSPLIRELIPSGGYAYTQWTMHRDPVRHPDPYTFNVSG